MSETPTTFIVLHEERKDEEWPGSSALTVTRIDGPLADKVRALYGKEGNVEIRQEGQEGGYSEYTVEWDWETSLWVNGEKVWPAMHTADEYHEVDFRKEGLMPKYGRPTRLAQHLLNIRDGKADR